MLLMVVLLLLMMAMLWLSVNQLGPARAAGFRVWRIDWTADGAPPVDRGLDAFAGRERRFGKTGAQVKDKPGSGAKA